jgi:hypothetical protein
MSEDSAQPQEVQWSEKISAEEFIMSKPDALRIGSRKSIFYYRENKFQ